MLRLRVFGAPSVERNGEALAGAARQRRVLGLLACIAASRGRGVPRDSLLALLWSESDTEKARQALTQALYHARRALQQDALFLSASDLRLNPAVFSSDVWEFEDALDRGDYERAVELHTSPYLDGFFVNDAAEFERWVAAERARLAERCAKALEHLAAAAEQSTDLQAAVSWRRRRAALDPLDSGAALQLMRARAAAGDRTGALQHARRHEILVHQELEVAPDPAILELANQLRRLGTPHPATPHPRHSTPGDSARGDSATSPIATPPIVTTAVASEPQLAVIRRRGLRRGLFAAGIIATVAAGSTVVLRATANSRAAHGPSNLIVITPFRVSGADHALAFLREGLVDLIATKLSDDGRARVADAASVIATWHGAGARNKDGASRDVALWLARQLGAGRVLVGSVVGVPTHLVLSASMLGASDGSVRAQASVEGPSDSLTAMIDRLVARLVAREAGVWDRLANHTSTSLLALRAYLDGQAAYRRGSTGEALAYFRRALDADSSFAMAGLGLAQAADRMHAPADLARGVASAWRHRTELVERDHAYLEALAGPDYPRPSAGTDWLAAWERATAANPDRPEVWVGLGKHLFYYGRLLGIADADQRAAAAFRRAAGLDHGFASPLMFLLQLAASAGDTTAVVRTERSYLMLDSVADLAGFVRWRSAVALGDTGSLTSLRHAFTTMPTVSLRAIALASLYLGIDGKDAERALSAIDARTTRGADRVDLLLAEHATALNRGELRRALRIIDALDEAQPLSPLPERLRVLDALYGGTDPAVGASSAYTLARRSTEPVTSDLKKSKRATAREATRSEDLCVAAQWNAWRGHSDEAARTAAGLAAAGPHDEALTLCGALVDAILAVRAHVMDADARLARLDSLLLRAPPASTLLGYANLALARLYAQNGDPQLALRVIRRHPFMEAWPAYLTGELKVRGTLAALAGDTATAVRAYRQFLAVRDSPDSTVQSDVDAVRRELQLLTGGT